MGATAVTIVMLGSNGAARVTEILQETRGQRARGLEHKQVRAWAMAPESNASTEFGTAGKDVSSNGAARIGTGQGSMRSTKFQGTAGYVTRMSGGVGGRGREASSYPDWLSRVFSEFALSVFESCKWRRFLDVVSPLVNKPAFV